MKQLFSHAQDPISCETHALGVAASFAGGLLFLLQAVYSDAGMTALASAMCFALSLMALYFSSALYHYYPGTADSGGVKRLLRKLDHSMIYVLIAGSYTPFCAVLLPQPRGLRFCLGIWCVAVAGVLMCSAYPTRKPTTGAMPGIKAFTAAVFGGIGSIPGAMLGGILLGVIEILGRAYVSSELGDAFVFAVLILVLLIKPTGLLGKKVREKV